MASHHPDASIQKDWETWLQEKVMDTMVLQQKTRILPDPDAGEEEEDDEDEDEECAVSADEIDKFFLDKGNNNIHNDDIGEDWNEITKSFEDDVKLFESDVPDVPDVTMYFFNEVEKVENNQNVKLTNEDKKIVATIRRAVVTYAENLKGLELPVSESDFDNAFSNMLTKRFLDKQDLKMDVGEIACWASSVLPGVEMKGDSPSCTRKSKEWWSPSRHRKKIVEDRIDLSVTMRDILYNFFKKNSGASGNDFHRTYVKHGKTLSDKDAQHHENTCNSRRFLCTYVRHQGQNGHQVPY
ncbi:hypothetical protein C1646_673094 [Rhizophagus diaphanus]|nr:hypothetical protein C1646_673094 [Rhizophagus diaphanus] [Rhizophagus sp. MUCL 43196]